MGLEPKKSSLDVLKPCDKIENLTGSVPQERNQDYYKKRPCAELVAMATEILDSL